MHYATFDLFMAASDADPSVPDCLRSIIDSTWIRRILLFYRSIFAGASTGWLSRSANYAKCLQLWSLHFKAKYLSNSMVLGGLALPVINCVGTPLLFYRNAGIQSLLLFDAILDTSYIVFNVAVQSSTEESLFAVLVATHHRVIRQSLTSVLVTAIRPNYEDEIQWSNVNPTVDDGRGAQNSTPGERRFSIGTYVEQAFRPQ